MLFHITTRAEWDVARASGSYRASSLETEGFLHLSTEAQWPRTAARFFRGRAGLVLLVIERARLTHEVRDEPADGELFPHLYGPLEASAVIEVIALEPDAKGLLHAAARETM